MTRSNCSRSITIDTWSRLSRWKQPSPSKIDTKFFTLNLSSTSSSLFEKFKCSSLIRVEPLYLVCFSRFRLSSWSCTWVRCITRASLNDQHHHLRSQKKSFSIEKLSMRLYDQAWEGSNQPGTEMTNASWEMSTPSQLTTQDVRSECHLDHQMTLRYPLNRTICSSIFHLIPNNSPAPFTMYYSSPYFTPFSLILRLLITNDTSSRDI